MRRRRRRRRRKWKNRVLVSSMHGWTDTPLPPPSS